MSWQFYRERIPSSGWEIWDQLNLALYNGHPYLDSAFLSPMLDHFGNKDVCLAEYKHDGDTLAMVLLERKKPGIIWQCFIPPQLQIAPLLIDPNRFDLIFSLFSPFRLLLRFYYLDILYHPLGSYRNVIASNHCITTYIRLEGSFHEFWGNRKKKMQQNVKRYFNRLGKDDINISFLCLESSVEISEAVRRYGHLESLGWKGEKGTAIHPDNVQGKFYETVLGNFANKGKAAIYELYFNGRLVASRLCIRNQEMVVMLKTTFDENEKQYSPGRILLYKVIEREFETRQCHSIEFYTNASKDQIDWSTGTRQIYHMDVYAHPWLKKMYLFQKKFRGQVK